MEKNFFMYDLNLGVKILFYECGTKSCKEMLILAVIHRCLERCLVKGKIIRNLAR